MVELLELFGKKILSYIYDCKCGLDHMPPNIFVKKEAFMLYEGKENILLWKLLLKSSVLKVMKETIFSSAYFNKTSMSCIQ